MIVIKKIIGMTVIVAVLILLIFFVRNLLKGTDSLISPLPDDQGIKVIYITPTKTK
jgi:hypothetical protein